MAGTTTKSKNQLYTEGANIDANYGPWESIEAYEAHIRDAFGFDTPVEGVTIAVKSNGKITKYVRQGNEWKQDGIELPPSDGKQYVMKNGQWVEVDIKTSADGISYDNSKTHFAADNVQDALDLLADAVDKQCVLTVKLQADNGHIMDGIKVHFHYIDDVEGTEDQEAISQYNRSTKSTIVTVTVARNRLIEISVEEQEGYAASVQGDNPFVCDKPTVEKNVLFKAHVIHEEVKLEVTLRNANHESGYSTNGKKVYFDLLDESTDLDYVREQDVITPEFWVATLNGNGEIAAVHEQGVEKNGLFIPYGTKYRVRLEPFYDTDGETEIFAKSEPQAFLAETAFREIYAHYTLKRGGMFILLEDYSGGTDLDTYKEYNAEIENGTVFVNDFDKGERFELSKDEDNNVIMTNVKTGLPKSFCLASERTTRFIGVGYRNVQLINSTIDDEEGHNEGCDDNCFIIAREGINYVSGKQFLDENVLIEEIGTWSDGMKHYTGKHATNAILRSGHSSDACQTAVARMKKVGQFVKRGFVPSFYQATMYRNARADMNIIFALFGASSLPEVMPSGSLIVFTSTQYNAERMFGGCANTWGYKHGNGAFDTAWRKTNQAYTFSFFTF